MSQQKPTNLFFSGTFIGLLVTILTAAQPTIADIAKNGGTFEKYYNLSVAFLASLGIAAEKMKEEKNVYTPNWFPLGRDKEDAVTLGGEQKTTLTPVVEATKQVSDAVDKVENVAKTADEVLKNPLNLLKIL